MREIIKLKLDELEQTENIKILYACESGSRAWGFASPDSDFDVRFIYSRNIDQYLSIRDVSDVVGLPVNEVLDIGGWDIKKALKLFLKSNGPLYEWLQSPIVYSENSGLAAELRSLMPRYFSLRAGANHYLSMAYHTLTEDLQAEQVKLKRYFYALRPALACMWVLINKEVPPMEFEPLRTIIKEQEIQEAIAELMERKQASDEKQLVPPVTILNNWLADQLKWCKQEVSSLPADRNDTTELDEVFRRYIL
ncbi:nucleotidyltransferase domain-containing protein [Pedobacter africanus]|uniref:Nucleotidyltransferase domain-containing protein n=1 Tax=Pedobacter africanus TaxID=151894 RepID=A0A1W2CR73_9SPHI|nr:nucleotidyltransferase domain-containing protein [Pedobacter africanus]SMC87709.1 hypothetical protein SAMN04488524_3152 [Pedobacter africanus]